MKMRIISAALAMALTACSRSNTPTETDKPGALSLNVSESGDTEGVTVQLIRVENDSRCPSGVMCVWAGNATAVITVRTPGMPPATLAQQFVNTTTEPRSVTVSGYRVLLDSLKPYPTAGKAIEQKDYVAYLTVSKVSGQ